jgi:cell fate regulator YaaT (PSP1 superfamily)
MTDGILVRYGAIPEVARFDLECAETAGRGAEVVVRTHRGLQVGTLLQPVDGKGAAGGGGDFAILRTAGAPDRQAAAELRADCERQFQIWRQRIVQWNLDLELIDLEWTLDRAKLILYVLNERGPDCTKLALHAAAAGLGLVEVQPVDENGLVAQPGTGGGCGSGGGGCGCHD